MRSILPSASRFLNSGGVFGFAMSHGSVRITLPAGVVILKTDCPSHWICTFPLCAPACPQRQANANAIAAKNLIPFPSQQRDLTGAIGEVSRKASHLLARNKAGRVRPGIGAHEAAPS